MKKNRLQKWTNTYISFVERFSIPLILFLLVFTSLVAPRAIQLYQNIRTDFKPLLPDHYESVKVYEEIEQHFGSFKSVQLIIETTNAENLKKAIPKLASFLEAHPAVKEVEFEKRAYELFSEHALFFPELQELREFRDRLDRRIQQEKLGKLFFSLEEKQSEENFHDLTKKYENIGAGKITSPFYTDDEEKIFVINIFPKNEAYDARFFKWFASEMQSRVNTFELATYDPSSKVNYMGGVIRNAIEYDSLMNDLKTSGIVASLAVLLLMVFYFRGFRILIFAGLPLVAGMIWSFALASHTVGSLNIITSFLFSILFGLGIDFGIHLNARYNEERRHGKTITEALQQMILHSGRSCFTAGVTTSSAFLVLTINDFKGFAEFGNIAGIGIMIVFVAYLLLLPPLFVLEERIPLFRRKQFQVTNWKLHHLRKISLPLFRLSLVLTLVMAFFLFFLKFNYDFTLFTSQHRDLQQVKELYLKVHPYRSEPFMVLVHSKDEALAVERAVNEIAKNEESLVAQARSIYSLVPSAQNEKIPTLREIHRLLDNSLLHKKVAEKDRENYRQLLRAARATPFTFQDLPEKMKEIFLSREGGEANQLVYIFIDPEVDLKDGKKAIALRNEIWNIQTPDGKEHHAMAASLIFADVLRVMLHDAPVAIVFSFLTVLIFLLFDFRSLKHVVVAFLPLGIGVVWMLGALVIFQEHLNFFNTIVLPIVLGIGIDNGVHLVHRFQEEGHKNIEHVMTHTGGAIIMTCLTTVFGFGGLLFAHHRGLFSLGLTAMIGVLACLFAALFFLPPVLSRIWKVDPQTQKCILRPDFHEGGLYDTAYRN